MTEAERFAALDPDECQLCGAYGADKRSLIIWYFYAIHEMVPEAIDLTDADGDLRGRGYYLRTCKTCRGEFLSMMREWRNKRVARRGVPKDHDGHEDDVTDGLVPVRTEEELSGLREQLEAETGKPHPIFREGEVLTIKGGKWKVARLMKGGRMMLKAMPY